MKQNEIPITRRGFIKSVGTAAATLAIPLATPLPMKGSDSSKPRIKLGFDNFSMRAWGWKAGQFLDYAASQKLDVMFFSDLAVYDSHEPSYLKDLKARADDLGLEIHVGTFSICPTSKSLTKTYGTPEEHLGLAIRIAQELGSPVVRCVLGNSEDRKVPGGIGAQIKSTVQVLKAVRAKALDAGVKIAVENHAGDMQAWELVALIEQAGQDFVGATMDPGNAAWTLEDPLLNLEILGPYALTTGIRDSAVWEYEQGATVQWTALGEGNVDFKKYAERYREICPKTPFLLEIISGFPRSYPYLQEEFWKPYANVRAHEFARFLALAKRGKAIPPFKPEPGQDRREAEKQYQKAELERSLKYCKEVLGMGGKG